MSKVRAAILGYGRSGGSLHAGAIEGNDDVELVAACDIDPKRRKQAAERFGCAVYEDYAVMLEQERPDLVCIVTRSDQHCAMTCDCLAAGCHVLVTKPWAVNASEGERMTACARRARGLLLPWLPARWGAELKRLRDLLAEGCLGDVFLVRRIVSSFGTRNDWQTERRYGGGYLLNWGPHIVDPPVLLMDSPVTSVYARMKQVINPGDAEDLFMAVLTLHSGALVQVEYTVSPIKHPGWFIQGTEGAVTIEGNVLRMHRVPPRHAGDPTRFASMQAAEENVVEETIVGDPYGDPHEVYRDVVAALRGERAFPVRPEAALGLSRLLDAIRESDRRNEVVHMSEGEGAP